MPAARYWRAVGLRSVGGGALELSALHLYLGGARVDAAATLTSTFAPASGTLTALQDEDTATTARWLDVSAPGFALVWDFGAGNAQDVAAVLLGSGALYTEWLETLTLQHSSDGVAWVTLESIPAPSWPGANVLQAAPIDGDVHFSAVSLLLHMDGADGSTAFTDHSPNPKAVTVYGNAKISTAQSKFGAASAYFDGSGGYLSIPYTADIDLLSGGASFTLECWVKADSFLKAYSRILSLGGGTRDWSASGIHIAVQERQGHLDVQVSTGGAGAILLTAEPIPQGVWVHLAAGYNSASGAIFGAVNGIYQQVVGGVPVRPSNNPRLEIATLPGDYGDSTYAWHGYIDDVRITKGVARYTANFTPPTAPFPDVSSAGAVFLPPLLRTPTPGRARIAASAPVPPHSTLSAPRLLTARNVEFAGSGTASATGTIYGSTAIAIKGSPNAPVRAKVSLLRARDLLLVRQTWSDPTTGAYAFHGLDPAEKYTTLAEYPTGDRRAVAADQLTPDIEEARAP